MTKLDWLLLFVLGVPLFSYVGDYWGRLFGDAVLGVRVFLVWLRSRREG